MFSRMQLIFGKSAIERLKRFRVAVFGIGGVGSFVVEALARSGIFNIDLIDFDSFEVTNINRQLYATKATIGQLKVNVAKARILAINDKANVKTYNIFYCDRTKNLFNFSDYDYVVDAIDCLKSKVLLVKTAFEYNVKIISSMGMGNRVNPKMLEVCDVFKTSVCPVAKIMRHELRKLKISSLKVIYSKEPPVKVDDTLKGGSFLENRRLIGSTAFVPSVAGLTIAGELVLNLLDTA